MSPDAALQRKGVSLTIAGPSVYAPLKPGRSEKGGRAHRYLLLSIQLEGEISTALRFIRTRDNRGYLPQSGRVSTLRFLCSQEDESDCELKSFSLLHSLLPHSVEDSLLTPAILVPQKRVDSNVVV